MRTTIPVLTAERLTSRVSIWMLGASQGNEQLVDRIETTVAVLEIVGFAPEIVADIVANAANNAGLPVADAQERFLGSVEAVAAPTKS